MLLLDGVPIQTTFILDGVLNGVMSIVISQNLGLSIRSKLGTKLAKCLIRINFLNSCLIFMIYKEKF